MAKRIIAVNGSPRKGWNTDLLVKEACKGAESRSIETEVVELYDLSFSGCVSCFGCKLPKSQGRCVFQDGLSPVLEKIRSADGLILGSPIYINEVTAGMRALVERLTFQYITYKKEVDSYNTRPIPVLWIFTSNCPEADYDKVGYDTLIKGYEQRLSRLIGPAKAMWSSETWQVNDYEKYDWTMFDAAARRERREKVFPQELQKAFSMGADLVK